MSMDLTTYLVCGFKTNRDEVEEKWPNAWEDLDSEPRGIVMVQSEAQDDIIIGRVIASVDKHDDEAPMLIEFPDKARLVMDLRALGFAPERIDTYLYGTWG